MRTSTAHRGITRALVLAGAAGMVALGGASALATGSNGPEATPDDLPDALFLDAVIRDFPDSHPDFQAFSGTTTVGLVNDTLDEDGLPTVRDLRGSKISKEFQDSSGRNINPALFDPAQGDVAGTLVDGPASNGFYSEESFSQWFRDVAGSNVRITVPLKLVRTPGTNTYVFDSASHEPYASAGGFFPINGQGYGDFRDGQNFHFTTMIDTTFVYDADSNPIFKFTGDDDVWVFIDDKLVVDLGGLHPKREQFLDLTRLEWLEDGEEYGLKIFHAERRTSQSNFRIETTLTLRRVELPTTNGAFD
ncbi:MAG: fibro-slime domain-containing protein [Planctomycetota bacterium]